MDQQPEASHANGNPAPLPPANLYEQLGPVLKALLEIMIQQSQLTAFFLTILAPTKGTSESNNDILERNDWEKLYPKISWIRSIYQTPYTRLLYFVVLTAHCGCLDVTQVCWG